MGSYYISLDDLKHIMYTRILLGSQKSPAAASSCHVLGLDIHCRVLSPNSQRCLIRVKSPSLNVVSNTHELGSQADKNGKGIS